jgi:acetyl/propionyl-CoA carboxylase alpha subunit
MAINKMIKALKDYKILGIKTSKKFMIDVLNHQEFRAGNTYTNFIERNMADRSVDIVPALELAAAVSSAALLQWKPTKAVGVKRDKGLSPWQTIGPWEIGMRISK